MKILLLSMLLCSCSTARKVAIVSTASMARSIEAHRNAKAFSDPIADRSATWHVLKYPQFALWASWGALIISKPTLGNILTGAVSIAIAWPVFELTLEKLRQGK